MQFLIDGLPAGIVLPSSHDEFVATFSPLYSQVLSALIAKEVDGNRTTFFVPFALACGFLAVAMKMPNQTDVAMLNAIMDDLKLPMSLLESHAARVPEIGDRTSIDDILSPALAFLRDLIQPLDPEPVHEPECRARARLCVWPRQDRHPLGDAARPIALANLYGLSVLPYASDKPDWQNDFRHWLGRLMLKAHLQIARGQTPAPDATAVPPRPA